MANQEFTPEELETEEWRKVEGFGRSTTQQEVTYYVSSLGRVVTQTTFQLKPSTSKKANDYTRVTLYKEGKQKPINVHQLVARTFLGPPPAGMIVNHKDTKKSNNKLVNLEYRTYQGNAQHASENGLLLKGQDNPSSKLTDVQAKEIIRRLAIGESCKSICRDYPVSDIVVGLIRQNRAWKHIPRPVSRHLGRVSTGRTYGEDSSSAKVTTANVLEIRKQHSQLKSLDALAKTFGLKKSQVWRIVTRKSWKHI